MSSQLFWHLGCTIARCNHYRHSTVTDRRFREYFGCSPDICKILWDLLEDFHPHGAHPKHLLYALLFLKQYNTEAINRALCKVDENTFRFWSWVYVHGLAELNVVRLLSQSYFYRYFYVSCT